MTRLSLLMVALLSLSLVACATPGQEKSYQEIKCPACGYQFETPAPKP